MEKIILLLYLKYTYRTETADKYRPFEKQILLFNIEILFLELKLVS